MKFSDWLEKNKDEDNIFPPPLEAQTAINFITAYLLGEDFYVSFPGSCEQVNTEIVYAILEKYSKKFKKEIKERRKK